MSNSLINLNSNYITSSNICKYTTHIYTFNIISSKIIRTSNIRFTMSLVSFTYRGIIGIDIDITPNYTGWIYKIDVSTVERRKVVRRSRCLR